MRTRLIQPAGSKLKQAFSTNTCNAIAIMRENYARQLQEEFPADAPYAVSDACLWGLQNRAMKAHQTALASWLRQQEFDVEQQTPLQQLEEMLALKRTPNVIFKEVIMPVTARLRPRLIEYQTPEQITFRNIKKVLEPFRFGKHRLNELSQTNSDEATSYHYAIQRLLDYYLFLFRNTLNIAPLQKLLNALETDKSLYQWLQGHLRTKPFQKQNELWRAGFHEHLPCSTIKRLLERASGMSEGAEKQRVTDRTDRLAAIDLLTLFWQMRTRSSSLLFREQNCEPPFTISSGHSPALKSALPSGEQLGSDLSTGTTAFHQELSLNTETAGSLVDIIDGAKRITDKYVLRGDEPMLPAVEPAFTIQGDDVSSKKGLANAMRIVQENTKQRDATFRFFRKALTEKKSLAFTSEKRPKRTLA